MADLNKALSDNASGPDSISVDGQTLKNRSVNEQIAAAKYLSSTRARTANRAAGVRFIKLAPHGSVLPGGSREYP